MNAVRFQSLRAMYEVDENVRYILDYVAGYQRSQKETTVDQMVDSDHSDRAVRNGFRALARAGVGKFIRSRSMKAGLQSRFEWYYRMMDVAAFAKGEDITLEPLKPEKGARTSAKAVSVERSPEAKVITRQPMQSVQYNFCLRHDFLIKLTLPSDFTAKEAERLKLFISSLPME